MDWKSKSPIKNKALSKNYISELEKKIKYLEAEKEILNRVIDNADEMLNIEIRKKYFPQSQAASDKQGEQKQNTLSEE